MATFKIGKVALGDVVFSTEEGRFVLAKNQIMAISILDKLRVSAKGLRKVCTLTEANVVVHRNGATVCASHKGEVYELDTVLVFGSPRGLDTTCPNRVVYKR